MERSASFSMSCQMYSCNKHVSCMTSSYCREIYDPADWPTEEATYPSCSDILGNYFNQETASSYGLRTDLSSSITAQNPCSSSSVSLECSIPYQAESESVYLGSPSPDTVVIDEERMRLKLQELERALLYESDDFINMDIDVQCTGSPKESTSSGSNPGSVNTDKERVISSGTPKEMLISCAAALSEGRVEEASEKINEIRNMVSIQGDPNQRIAAYMMEGLAARMAASGKILYKALKCKEPPSSARLAAMQILFEVCPCFKFGFMAANGAIIEASKGEKRIHIIDFDINQGNQYINLIQLLANQPGKPPHLRLTGVDDPESVQRPNGGILNILMRLEKLAEELGVPFEYRAVASKTSIITPSMLDYHPEEALIVNFAFQLHHMPDESVSTVNLRDQLLQMVKSLNPKLVTIVEQDVNTNTAPFFPRFIESYNYYSVVFDSLDVTLPRASQDRTNVEKHCLARDIVNIVACEGEERIERYEVAGKWRARMTMAGFTSCSISQSVTESIGNLIKEYSDRYKVKEEMGALHFGWEDKSLVVASAWK